MSDEEARGEAAALAIQIDDMVVRPEPVDWQKVIALAQDIVLVATAMADEQPGGSGQGRPPA